MEWATGILIPFSLFWNFIIRSYLPTMRIIQYNFRNLTTIAFPMNGLWPSSIHPVHFFVFIENPTCTTRPWTVVVDAEKLIRFSIFTASKLQRFQWFYFAIFVSISNERIKHSRTQTYYMNTVKRTNEKLKCFRLKSTSFWVSFWQRNAKKRLSEQVRWMRIR